MADYIVSSWRDFLWNNSENNIKFINSHSNLLTRK